MKMPRAVLWGAAAALTLGICSPALARPQYRAAFIAKYKTTNLSKSTCATCHIGMPREARWNPYGRAVRMALGATNVMDAAKINEALAQAERGRNQVQMMTFGQLLAADKQPALGVETRAGQAAANPPAQPPATTPRTAPAPDPAIRYGTWRSLFNGVNSEGWTKVGAGDWVVENGYLKLRANSGNGWLRTNEQFGNYALVIVWRYPNAGNNDAGIFLKAKDPNRTPWGDGPQLNMGPGDNLGSIGGITGSRQRPDLIKRNDWNTYQVTVYNGQVSLAINNQPAWEQQGTSNALMGQGYIGIQAENFPLEILSIHVMPLQ